MIRDLSTPQPKIPFWLRPILSLLSLLSGIILLFLSVVFLIVDVYVMFMHRVLQFRNRALENVEWGGAPLRRLRHKRYRQHEND